MMADEVNKKTEEMTHIKKMQQLLSMSVMEKTAVEQIITVMSLKMVKSQTKRIFIEHSECLNVSKYLK